MYDIHSKAEAIRAEGLQEIELPFGRLTIAGTDSTNSFMYPTICKRMTLTTTIDHIFEISWSDRIILGIIDPSNFMVHPRKAFVSDGLEVSRDLEISASLAEDIWVILRSLYEDYAFQHPNFHRVYTAYMRRVAIREMNESRIGHC